MNTQLWVLKQKGFTIVELLIVIVVIAILATITTVAYNGIRQRAAVARQTAAMDRIGKAIQLWSAEKGMSFSGSGAGLTGAPGQGWFQSKNSNNSNYTVASMEEALRSSGYLTGGNDQGAFDHSQVMLAACTNSNDSRWVVMATVSPAPSRAVTDQIADTGCTNGYLTSWTGVMYNKNFVKVY